MYGVFERREWSHLLAFAQSALSNGHLQEDVGIKPCPKFFEVRFGIEDRQTVEIDAVEAVREYGPGIEVSRHREWIEGHAFWLEWARHRHDNLAMNSGKDHWKESKGETDLNVKRLPRHTQPILTTDYWEDEGDYLRISS
jgi:hypothetical protein